MVGEDVRVARWFKEALLPPSLVTRKKDENKDSEEEDDSQCMEGNQFGWIYGAGIVQKIAGGRVK